MELQTETGQKLPVPKVLAVIVALGVVILGTMYFVAVTQNKSDNESEDIASIPNVQDQQGQEGSSEGPAGMAVILNGVNNSGLSGIAVLGEKSNKTIVSLGVSGVSESEVMPVHIHKGLCSDLGEIAYPLKDVSGGNSETALDFGIEKLRNELPLALNVHKSTTEVETSVVCGDLK